MEKTEIAENLFRFSFPPSYSPRINQNISVLTDDRGAALIDPSYPMWLAGVRQELKKRSIDIGDVIISHYNGDHCRSLPKIKGAEIWGSENYLASIKGFVDPTHCDEYRPTKKVEYGKAYDIAGHKIVFYEGSGHRACGIFTAIDDRFIHVNDLLMTNEDGVFVIPYVKDGISNYKKSLEFLRSRRETILMAHGRYHTAKEVDADIRLRMKYLEGLETNGGAMDIDGFERESGI
jgi:glyoxylase-like metal-dependent hydrolase (beta-lactamase superfamily II)